MQQFTPTLLSRRADDYHHLKKKGGRGLGEGATVPELKWRRWSNGRKNQNSKKSLGLPTKPKKIPCRVSEPWKFPKTIKRYNMLYFFWLYFKVQNYEAGIRGHYRESSDCFEYPKKSLLKSSHPKTILAQFSYPKNSQIENFKPPKIFRSSLLL